MNKFCYILRFGQKFMNEKKINWNMCGWFLWRVFFFHEYLKVGSVEKQKYRNSVVVARSDFITFFNSWMMNFFLFVKLIEIFVWGPVG